MRLKGTVTVNASQEEVWRIIADPIQFCRVMPGCAKARKLDDTHYEAMLAVRVQFITIRSKALGTILESRAPHHLVGELVGEQQAVAGSYRNRVTIDLVPINNKTKIQYTMDITMLGRFASMGEAIVRLTSNRISKEFADNISKLFNNRNRR
jgi:uncharacterized protein